MSKTAMQELIEHMEYFKDYSPFARDSIKKATELLAKEKADKEQEAIGFAEWVNKGGYILGVKGWINMKSENYYSTEQLYSIYLKQNEK